MANRISAPTSGTRIGYENNKIVVPDDPIVPYIEGDGTGPDIWKATQYVLDGAVRKVYGGKRQFHWHEVFAGDKANEKFGEYLPEETIDALRYYRVSIKGPLATPVGGGIRSLNVTLLETAAGQGSCLGCTFEELGRVMSLVDDKRRVGICIDTCHIFAAGYDIRTREGYERMIDEVERHVGVENVGAFHINDSKRELGSRVDRHEHIGKGQLGLDAFAFVLNDPRFARIPKMIETPKTKETASDRRNLRLLRSLMSS